METQTAIKTERAHRWELAGLGNAPFRYLGMFEKTHDCGFGVLKAGGTCDYCGQGIRYCFSVQSSDGKKFVVGCDCIAHCHDPAERIVIESARALKAFKAKKAGDAKAAKLAIERKARQDAQEAARRLRVASLGSDPLYALLTAYAARNDFIASMRDNMERYDLTERQETAAREAIARIDRAEVLQGKSHHLGRIGERVTIKGTVEMSRLIHQGVGYGDPDRYMTKIRTDDLAIVTWFGAYGMTKGAKIEGTATVKDHSTYQGEAQTLIKNPRWRE